MHETKTVLPDSVQIFENLNTKPSISLEDNQTVVVISRRGSKNTVNDMPNPALIVFHLSDLTSLNLDLATKLEELDGWSGTIKPKDVTILTTTPSSDLVKSIQEYLSQQASLSPAQVITVKNHQPYTIDYQNNQIITSETPQAEVYQPLKENKSANDTSPNPVTDFFRGVQQKFSNSNKKKAREPLKQSDTNGQAPPANGSRGNTPIK